jgi:arginine deiminase
MPWEIMSDIDPLRVVLLHKPGKENEWVSLSLNSPWDALVFPRGARAACEHQEYVKLIKENSNAKIYFIEELINDILAKVDKKERSQFLLEALGEEKYFKLRKFLTDEEITADHILGRVHPFKYLINSELIIKPISSLIWARDFSVVTQGGLLISHYNGLFARRKDETGVVKAIYKWHPEFQKNLIILEDFSLKEKFFLQGGDVIPIDEESIAVGTNGRTTRNAVEHLAKLLYENSNVKNVYSVNMPSMLDATKRKTPNILNSLWIHLDSFFNFVDDNKVVTVLPTFRKHMKQILYNIIKITKKESLKEMKKGEIKPSILRKYASPTPPLKDIKDMGKCTVLRKGKKSETKNDFLEALVEDSKLEKDEIITVGGSPEDYPNIYEYIDAVLREFRFQAANVLPLKKGVVIAYDENKATLNALKNHGIKVLTFAAPQLSFGMGGPHCLAMTLFRK